jgi:hypothetical protein
LDAKLFFGNRLDIGTRFSQNDTSIRDYKNQTAKTPFGDHRQQSHKDEQVTPTSLTIEILQVCKDVAELKITESIHIRNHRPKLNTQVSSWKMIPPVQYTPD